MTSGVSVKATRASLFVTTPEKLNFVGRRRAAGAPRVGTERVRTVFSHTPW